MNVLLLDCALILPALHAATDRFGVEIAFTSVRTMAEVRRTLRASTPCGLVLLNINIGEGRGYDLLGELSDSRPGTPVVVLSAFGGDVDILRAISLGAAGFLSASAPFDVLIETLREAVSRLSAQIK